MLGVRISLRRVINIHTPEIHLTSQSEITFEPSNKKRESRPWGSYEILVSGSGFQTKRLTVKTESPTWRQELHMQKKEIIDKINNKIGSKTIKEIRFI